ncbi:endoplasmic reticulum-based factor for assembly of V-ATPase-domain-containing protein [Paraphysoderma sedebokerense]|nr:endoplasmic reticulum-based factor for assembly of V-ATPase-domain-containing protein [Paraphysoderma sedebokerense]
MGHSQTGKQKWYTIDCQFTFFIPMLMLPWFVRDPWGVYLHEIIQNSRIIAHSPPKREKSPELLSILENIQARKSNLEYFDMLRTVLPNEHQSTLANSLKLSDTDLDRLSSPASSTPLPNLNSVNEAKAIFKTFTTIINVLFTVVSVFVAVFWISHHVSDDIALRTLVSFLAALLLAVAEGFLIYRATERDEKAAKTHVLHD